jgi:hypothetical protein
MIHFSSLMLLKCFIIYNNTELHKSKLASSKCILLLDNDEAIYDRSIPARIGLWGCHAAYY